jgi:hypothetical protein
METIFKKQEKKEKFFPKYFTLKVFYEHKIP